MGRVPSPSMLNMVTAVLVQREIGGNLTEILEKISSVIRGRFKFQRKVKTLTAEARLSAWILVLLPFGLFVLMYLTTPSYVETLTKDPNGPKIVALAFGMMMAGVFWIRKLITGVMKV
jgi:tight adherence protein B